MGTGIRKHLRKLDSRLRGNDKRKSIQILLIGKQRSKQKKLFMAWPLLFLIIQRKGFR